MFSDKNIFMAFLKHCFLRNSIRCLDKGGGGRKKIKNNPSYQNEADVRRQRERDGILNSARRRQAGGGTNIAGKDKRPHKRETATKADSAN